MLYLFLGFKSHNPLKGFSRFLVLMGFKGEQYESSSLAIIIVIYFQ